MSDISEVRKKLVGRILAENGKASPTLRRAAFDSSGLTEPLNSLVGRVAMDANTVTDEDIKAAKRSGLNEDQIFEIMVCAAIGQANRQYDSAIEALDIALRSQ